MKDKYMVEMWWADKREAPADFVWYHATPKQAKTWAMDYAKKTGACFFSVLYVFNGGHYRTIVNQEVSQ